MTKAITESEFYMWRAIFALAHADHVVTRDERRFMQKVLDDTTLTPEQKETLRGDIEAANCASEMFARITDQDDRSRFFYFARMLLWCDGDFAEQEQRILTELGEKHYRSVDFEQMVGGVQIGLELEEEQKQWLREDIEASSDTGGILSLFVRRFLRG